MVLISDFIKELEKIKSQYGDIPVVKCKGKGYQENTYFVAANIPQQRKMVYRYGTEYELVYGFSSPYPNEESVCVIHFS